MVERHIQVVEPEDNVATALRDIESGETLTIAVGDGTVTVEAQADVEFGHKIALEDIPNGETVVKYGKSIGNATEDIEAGEWVHVHNVESNYGRGDLAADDAEANA
ncbi:MAG: UxaA family hydrolase [Haloferacaceae archaeon]